ncbi:uncharacterized protein [Palaemon carinicauda]|uniref:uncharacterized protein n=1 Tax=Palaemon carinicauda TaxID=392227 RepID=UPI0035B5886D
MDLVNQLAKFTPEIELMSPKRALVWTPNLNEAFRQVKAALRLKEKISLYLFTVVGQARKQLSIPDALSRAPVSHPTLEDEITCADAATQVRYIININVIIAEEVSMPQDADRTLQELPTTARADPSYTLLMNSDGDLVFYGARQVFPAARCRCTLAHLHNSHRGMEATKRRARQTVFWPGIDSDISSNARAFDHAKCCSLALRRNHPTRPFDSILADIFSVARKSFIIVTDQVSWLPVVVPFFFKEVAAKSEDCDRCAAAHAEQVKLQCDQHTRPLPKLGTG